MFGGNKDKVTRNTALFQQFQPLSLLSRSLVKRGSKVIAVDCGQVQSNVRCREQANCKSVQSCFVKLMVFWTLLHSEPTC